MPTVLTRHEIDRYHEAGYHFPVPILSPEEARSCRERLEAFERRQGRPLRGAYRQKTHLLFTWLDALIRDPPRNPSLSSSNERKRCWPRAASALKGRNGPTVTRSGPGPPQRCGRAK